MAKVYGTVGSLSQLLDELEREDVGFIHSLEDIFSFTKEFDIRLSNIKEELRQTIVDDINELGKTLVQLGGEYNSQIEERKHLLTLEKNEIDSLINHASVQTNNVFRRLFNSNKRSELEKRKTVLFTDFDEEVRRPFIKLNQRLTSARQRLQNIEDHFVKILGERALSSSKTLYSAKRIIEENGPTLAGAIGEQKAVDELKKLPDSFIIINDFRFEFRRALHKNNTDDWIRSIQSDHLLIGPPGVFVIETKNWSNDSVQSLDLYSPVQQIQRTNYAIYMLLNRILANNFSPLNHHWGPRQISVNNIILMINNKPTQEFQHVKVLTLTTICPYLRHMKPIFNSDEVQEIANLLLGKSD